MTRLKRIILGITAITAATDTAAIILTDKWAVATALITAAGLITAIIYSYSAARDATEKVKIMIEALRNNDFSFRLQKNINPEIAESFTEISDIIKKHNIASQQKEKFYNLIINNVRTGIFAIDSTGNVELCNAAALKLLGLPVLTNAKQLDRIEPGLQESLKNMTMSETRILSIENNHRNSNISVTVSKIELGGKPLSIYILNDINSVIDRQEVDAWIKLTRVLTHEIMNGIAPIRAMSEELLHNGMKDHSHATESLGIISSTSEGLMKFTQSFRKFAAIPSPELALNYVRDLINSSISLKKEALSHINITIDIIPDNIIVESDKSLINQVLVNLLKNAIEAGATTIHINSHMEENESVIIDVTDNGQPISEDCAEQIFVPFFTTKNDGSGIGLSMSRRIMNLHGGTLQLINGSYTKTFRLKFP